MTVIRPNSISGITSITAQANEINIFRSDGTLAGLQINGINFNNTSGISTLAALNVTGNVSIAGTLTYEDVTNVDSVGIITARSTIDAQGDISIVDKIIHTGDTNTSIRFPADDTISLETAGSERLRVASTGNVSIGNNATPDTLLHLHGDKPKLRVESTNTLEASAGTEEIGRIEFEGTKGSNRNVAASLRVRQDGTWSTVDDWFSPTAIEFYTQDQSGTEITEPRFTITSEGKVGINSSAPNTKLDVIESSVSRTWTPGSSVVSMFERDGHCRIAMVAGSSSYSSIDFGDTSNDNSGHIKYDHDDNSMSFRTNSNVIDKLRILSDGKIGIGTDPTYGLDIMHDTGIIVRTSTNGVGAAISFTDASINNWDQIGTIKYLHQNNVVENGIAEGFIIQGTEATTAVRIEGLLRVTAQPCASVYQCTGPSGSSITSDSQNDDPLHFDHVDINQGGMAIANNNARITVPVDGIYLVTMMVAGTVSTPVADDGLELNLRRNGAEYPAANSRAEPVFNMGRVAGDSEFFCTNMLYVQCTRGDYLELAISNINNSDATINRGNFGVMLMA